MTTPNSPSDYQFITSAGYPASSDREMPLFLDMEMPESVFSKRMTSFEAAESISDRINVAFMMAKLKNAKPLLRRDAPSVVENYLNSSAVVHEYDVDMLADLGAVNYRASSKAARILNAQENERKPWFISSESLGEEEGMKKDLSLFKKRL